MVITEEPIRCKLKTKIYYRVDICSDGNVSTNSIDIITIKGCEQGIICFIYALESALFPVLHTERFTNIQSTRGTLGVKLLQVSFIIVTSFVTLKLLCYKRKLKFYHSR